MGEVRACVYFSVIFLCFQISSAKPFFGDRFWCDMLCDEDDGLTTLSSEADYFDSWCDDCPTRRPRPMTTPMPSGFANPAIPAPPGMPAPPGVPAPPGFPGSPAGPPINIMMNPPQNGGGINFSMLPDGNRGWNFFWNPFSGSGGANSPNGQPPNATPAPVSPPATPAAPVAAAATPAPAVAAPPAAPAAPDAPATPAPPAAPAAARK